MDQEVSGCVVPVIILCVPLRYWQSVNRTSSAVRQQNVCCIPSPSGPGSIQVRCSSYYTVRALVVLVARQQNICCSPAPSEPGSIRVRSSYYTVLALAALVVRQQYVCCSPVPLGPGSIRVNCSSCYTVCALAVLAARQQNTCCSTLYVPLRYWLSDNRKKQNICCSILCVPLRYWLSDNRTPAAVYCMCPCGTGIQTTERLLQSCPLSTRKYPRALLQLLCCMCPYGTGSQTTDRLLQSCPLCELLRNLARPHSASSTLTRETYDLLPPSSRRLEFPSGIREEGEAVRA